MHLISEFFNNNQRIPSSFFRKKSNRILILRYLIENCLNRKDQDRFLPLSTKIFKQYNLQSLLTAYYRGSSRRALEEAYGDVWDVNPYENFETLLIWLFKGQLNEMPRYFWKDSTRRIDTIRALVKFTNKDIYELTTQDFRDHGLFGFLTHYYGCSPFKAILEAYPEAKLFLFSRIDKTIWNCSKTRLEALKYHLDPHGLCSPPNLAQLRKMGIKNSLISFYGSDALKIWIDFQSLKSPNKSAISS